MDSLGRIIDRFLLCYDRVLRIAKRELHHCAFPSAVRGRLLVHRVDVSSAGAFHGHCIERRDPHQALPRGRVIRTFPLLMASFRIRLASGVPGCRPISTAQQEASMFRPQRLFSLGSLAILTVVAVACGSRHDSDENYYLVGANIKLPYWDTAGVGFSTAASQLRVRAAFVGPDTYDPKAEKQAFDELIPKKPAGILVSPADPEVMKDSIDRAIAAGIPVITVDSDAPRSKRLFFIGTNNHQAGFTGGKRLAQELKG